MSGEKGGGKVFSSFDHDLERCGLFPFVSEEIETVQVNLGRLCNQTCRHCHVEAGPERTEVMSEQTLSLVLEKIEELGSPVVDITGGAPEMNPFYRPFVKKLRALGCRVMTRTNLTILLEEDYRDIPDLWAELGVEVEGSLPHYDEATTDRLRGKGVFRASIEALRILNKRGYGGPGLVLNLVYNPCGAFLPPGQKSLEADFRRELRRRYGVEFTGLFALTNMPVGRFRTFLERSGNLDGYMERLKSLFNPGAAKGAMCRYLISIGWDGSIYDCDFNQMLGIKCNHGAPDHLKDFDAERLRKRRIMTGRHCYGCTAGTGSSCTGAVA